MGSIIRYHLYIREPSCSSRNSCIS